MDPHDPLFLMCMHLHSQILNFMGSHTAVSDLRHIVAHVLHLAENSGL